MIKTQIKKPWLPFAFKAFLIGAAILFFISWFESRFRVGIDAQMVRCFPDHKYFFVDMKYKSPEVDQIIAYKAKGLEPYFRDGTMMAKIVSGMPGDHLIINDDGVFINGQLKAKGFAQISRLNKPLKSLFKDEIIPDDHYFLLAPAPESYDGRYWGYINKDQIVGKAFPFF